MAPPDDYGWAYIDPQRASASADGPSGSLQFRYGSEDLSPGQFSGSEDLVFYAAAASHKADADTSGSALYLYGNLYVTGAVHANTYEIRQVTTTEIDVSGSTIFGDSNDDTHQRTGSFEISGWTILASNLDVSGTVGPLTSSGEIHAQRLVSSDARISGSIRVGHTGIAGGISALITNSGSSQALSIAGGMSASHDVKVEHLYTNDLYVSGTTHGVSINLGDDEEATWGDSNDLTIVHTGGNTSMTNDTGHFIINSNSSNGKLILKTGTNNASTQVVVDNNAGSTIFAATGGGNVAYGLANTDHNITGTLVVSGLEHQITGTLEISDKVNISGQTRVLDMISGSGALEIYGSASFGSPVDFSGDLTFNVADVDGRVDFMIEDGSGPESALQLRKNGRVTKIGHDTPSNGQVLTWDGTSGWVEWGDGVIGISGSDVHYSRTELRTSGDLNVSGSSMLAGDITTTGSIYVENDIIHYGDVNTKITFDQTNMVRIFTDGYLMMEASSSGIGETAHIDFNQLAYDVDFRVYATNPDDWNKRAFFVDGANGSVVMGNSISRATTTFYNTITGAVGPDDQGGGDIHANEVIVNDLSISGSLWVPEDDLRGLTIRRKLTGDNNPVVLTLATSETQISNSDAIGKIAFQAPDESSGGDAKLVCAAIEAKAGAVFGASQNPTSLLFMTSKTGAPTTHLELDADGILSGSNWEVNPAGTGSYSQLHVWSRILCGSDTGDDTFIEMKPGHVSLHANTIGQPQVTISTAGVVINDASNGTCDFRVESNSYDDMLFVDAGNNRVGIMTGTPSADLHVVQNGTSATTSGLRLVRSGSPTNYWNILQASGGSLMFAYEGSQRGYLSTAVDVANITFTGQHIAESSDSLKTDENIGLIVSSTGVLKNLNAESIATINESLPIVNLSNIINDKKVFGVISRIEDSGTDERTHSAGNFVSSYEKLDNRLIVNSIGEGAVWVIDKDGPLENGDYITTCTVPGYGVPQADDLLHNYTVAKITQDCSFDLSSTGYTCEEITIDGVTYLRALVACTYHCG